MLTKIGKRLTYANVIMTVGLVFAMGGGAYAAGKYVITSTKQISPKVLKQLVGKSGPVGPVGPAGPAGTAGPTGPGGAVGTQGLKGEQGLEGKEGKEGKQGKEGKEGKEGSPWTAGGVLPSGSTETGVWMVRDTASAENEARVATISFPIPPKEAPTASLIKVGESDPPGCKGTVSKPEADPGNLCAFEGEAPIIHAGHLKFVEPVNPGGSNVGTTGAELIFATEAPAKAGEEVSAEGTWAMTAK